MLKWSEWHRDKKLAVSLLGLILKKVSDARTWVGLINKIDDNFMRKLIYKYINLENLRAISIKSGTLGTRAEP